MLRNLQLSVKLTTDLQVDYLTATGLCPVTLDGRLREEQQDLHCKGHYANAEAYCCVLTHENY